MAELYGCPVWDEELDRELFTSEVIALSDIQAEIISAFIEARKEKGLSQRDLEALSGIKQPQIARMEKGTANPQLATLVKVLAAMGKKLAIVPL